MKIIHTRIGSVELRLTENIATGAGTLGDRSGIRIALQADNGLRGEGEAAPIPGVSSSGGLEALARELQLWCADSDGCEVDERIAALDTSALSPAARFAAHTALIELQCLEVGLPLHQWLRSGSGPVVRVNALVANETPGDVHAAVVRAADAGATAVKLKVGVLEPAKDVTRIIAASEAAGPNIELRLDANSAWSAEQVVHVVGRVGQHRLGYIEDPTPNIDEFAQIAETTGVATAVDADPTHSADLVELMERSGASVLVIKPAAAGGVDRIVDVARQLDSSQRVIVSSSIDGEIALRAALHGAAAVPRDDVHGLATAHLVRGVPESLRSVDGAVILDDRPGLGTEDPT